MSGLKVEKRERENSRQLVGRFIRSLRKSGLVYRAKKNRYGRFIRSLRKSGLVYRAKKNRYTQKPLSNQLKKKAALRKEELKKKYERLEKLGKTR
jgi:predicted transcriptional regulator